MWFETFVGWGGGGGGCKWWWWGCQGDGKPLGNDEGVAGEGKENQREQWSCRRCVSKQAYCQHFKRTSAMRGKDSENQFRDREFADAVKGLKVGVVEIQSKLLTLARQTDGERPLDWTSPSNTNGPSPNSNAPTIGRQMNSPLKVN